MLSINRFPKNLTLRKEWLRAIRKENFELSKHKVCSNHFEESCFDRTGQTVRLRMGSVPTIFTFPSQVQVIFLSYPFILA